MRSIPLWAALALLLGLATAKASSGSGSSSSSMWQRALFARNSRNLRHHSGPAALTSSSSDPSSDVGLGAFDVFASNANNNNNNVYGQLFAPYALEQQPQQQQQLQPQPQHQQVSASDGREGESRERAESKKQLSRRSAAALARGKLHLWLLCEICLKYEKRENMFKLN